MTHATALRRPLACLAALAAGLASFLVVTAPAASADTTTHAVPGTAGFNGLACASSTTCIAVGISDTGAQTVVVTLTNGAPGPAQAIAGLSNLFSIACPTSTLCIANGSATDGSTVLVSLVQGGVRQVLDVGGMNQFGPLACPSASFCLLAAAPNVILVHIAPDGSLSASTGDPMPAQIILNGLACSSATSCTGAGSILGNQHGVLVPFTNGSVGVPVQVNGVMQFDAIGCSSSGDCLAGGRTSDAFHGGLVPLTIGGAGPLQSTGTFVPFGIACPSSSECISTGAGEAVLSTPAGVPQATTPLSFEGDHAACPTAVTCLVAGQVQNPDNTFTGMVDTIAAAFTASPTSVTFAHRRVGTVSAPSTVTVTNTGNLPLVFSSVALSGAGTVAFKIVSNTCTGALAPGAQCATGITFKPGADKTYNAVLTYTDNAPAAPQSIPVSGRGCAILSGSFCS